MLSLTIDFFDLNLLTVWDKDFLKKYQNWDKILDLNYLVIEAYVALRWKNRLASSAAFGLFVYRLIGIITFEITQQKFILVVFPNIFEPFFLIYLIQVYIFKKDILKSLKIIAGVILIITVFKLSHEYLLHINTTHPWTENKYIKKIIDPDFIAP